MAALNDRGYWATVYDVQWRIVDVSAERDSLPAAIVPSATSFSGVQKRLSRRVRRMERWIHIEKAPADGQLDARGSRS